VPRAPELRTARRLALLLTLEVAALATGLALR